MFTAPFNGENMMYFGSRHSLAALGTILTAGVLLNIEIT